jgi:hypothetical protein
MVNFKGVADEWNANRQSAPRNHHIPVTKPDGALQRPAQRIHTPVTLAECEFMEIAGDDGNPLACSKAGVGLETVRVDNP